MKNTQKNKVAIQGYEGCFHQVAAQLLYGNDVEVIPCANFRDLIAIASNAAQSTGGVMAIENSIAGSILPNYTLLQNAENLTIVGEVYLPIQQHLLVNKGVKLEDIHEVHSHYMAIQQCMEYLGQRNWKLVETEDTALSAKHVHQRRSTHIAAVASELAANLYHLEIVAENIHTQKSNYTRFLKLSRTNESSIATDANKASIWFTTNHTKGSLANVLSIIAAEGINLSKLQSMPIAGTNFQYSFYADLEFNSLLQFEEVKLGITNHTQKLKIFGVYKSGQS
jgi:prephenate dehydratase